MNPAEIKEDFPILREKPELVYLDNAATTQKPDSVIERVKKFYETQNANVGRGLYGLASEATREYKKSRKEVSDFINARSDELIFVRNTTESQNLLASSLDVEGNIVLPEMAHHSEQLPWRRKAERNGLEIDYIPTKKGELDIEEAKKVIDQDTELVSVSHVSNVFGSVNPIEELVELAHDNDALISVDGAQSVPRMKTDVKDLDVDFLSFSGHKMVAPNGIGAVYGKKHILDKMDPYQVGGGMIRTVKTDRVEWEKVPEKFEAGTPNIAGAVGLAESVRYLEDMGMEDLRRHDRRLCNQAADLLGEVEGVNLLKPEGKNFYVVSFTMDSAHPHDIAEILDRNDVAVRAGHHCAQPQMESLGISGTVRVSPYLYNTEQDICEMVKAVKEVKKVFG